MEELEGPSFDGHGGSLLTVYTPFALQEDEGNSALLVGDVYVGSPCVKY